MGRTRENELREWKDAANRLKNLYEAELALNEYLSKECDCLRIKVYAYVSGKDWRGYNPVEGFVPRAELKAVEEAKRQAESETKFLKDELARLKWEYEEYKSKYARILAEHTSLLESLHNEAKKNGIGMD